MNKTRRYTAEEKIDCVKRHIKNGETKHEISRRTGIHRRNIVSWVQKYEEYGEAYFFEEHRGKSNHNGKGNPFAALHTSKRLTKEERLELENLKLKIENERLKKGYAVKGVGANKEFVTISDANMK